MKREYDTIHYSSRAELTECLGSLSRNVGSGWKPHTVLPSMILGEEETHFILIFRDVPDEPEKVKPEKECCGTCFRKCVGFDHCTLHGRIVELSDVCSDYKELKTQPAPTAEQMFEAVCKALVQSMRKRCSLSFISCATLNRTAYDPPPDLITSLKAELDRIQDRDLRLAKIQERDSC